MHPLGRNAAGHSRFVLLFVSHSMLTGGGKRGGGKKFD